MNFKTVKFAAFEGKIITFMHSKRTNNRLDWKKFYCHLKWCFSCINSLYWTRDMLRNIHRSNLNELLYAVAKEFASWRSVHGSTLGYWTINFTILKIFPNFIWKNQGGAYFDAGSPLAVVSENFMRISRLVRHVFGFGAYSRTPSPDI